ncbi:MAG: hypothetical protein H6708_34525 [Kofleriaceae bacterium]|nr:hypothetical protein [Myxococcales bacterium]MCB9565530.1 hypothetical protein [Kofleriaceae bacterium]
MLILTTALLSMAGLAVYLALADTNAARFEVHRRSALYCAEAGLEGSLAFVNANVASWGLMLDVDPSNDPPGYPVTGDLDGDGVADWQVTLKDNDDELGTNDPTVDSDGAVFVVSRCIANAETPAEVMTLIAVGGGGTNYRTQAGAGGGNTGNAN